MTAQALLRGLWASSVSAGLLTLAALLLRAAFQHRTPRRLFCLLWDAAMLRLLILRPLPSPLSIWRRLPASAAAPGAGAGGAPGPAVFGGAAGGAALPGSAGEWGGAASAAFAPALPSGPAAVLAVWLAGALALAVWFCRGHLRGLGRYADALPCTDPFVRGWLAGCGLRRRVRVSTSDRIAAPLTYGVLHPVILLPSGTHRPDPAALPYVLQHEIQHIRRFDTLRKALFAAALCLHWFDPFAWLLFVMSGREAELACDEAVIAGGADPAGYALALLRMEERRGGWGLAGSHFSQNALEERVQAMIKHKKSSLAAAVAVIAAMSVAATVFAAPAPEGTEPPAGQNPPETAAVYNHAQAVEGDLLILSQGGEEGEKQYSVDGGKTWLTEADYRARYGASDWQVEWWTAGDYAVWLAEEKQMLQSIIGERGYTSGEGWFTWDQQRVDEAIALYESILQNIKNGVLYSKTITDPNGGAVEEIMLGSGTLTAAEVFSLEEKNAAAPGPADEAALREELKAFGVAGDADRLTWRGQPVRRLVDGVPAGESGYSIRYVYENPDGAVDLHTLRAVRVYPDGSCDPMGELIGLAAAGDPGFDQGLIDAALPGSAAPAAYAGGSGGGAGGPADPDGPAACAGGSGEGGGRSFEEIFAQYQPYGLTYAPSGSGRGSLSWNGRAVKSFADRTPGGGVFSYEDPAAQDGLRVRTEYDAGGRLIGLCAE